MLTPEELALSRKVAAKLQAQINERKTQSVVKAGYLPSQFGKVVQNEQRLIDNGHYMKSAEKAKLDYYREEIKRKKAEKPSKVVVVKR